jgi:hypothetical protein
MFNRLNNPSPMLSRLSAVRAVGARQWQHCPMTTGNKPKPHPPFVAICGPRGAAALDLLLSRRSKFSQSPQYIVDQL